MPFCVLRHLKLHQFLFFALNFIGLDVSSELLSSEDTKYQFVQTFWEPLLMDNLKSIFPYISYTFTFVQTQSQWWIPVLFIWCPDPFKTNACLISKHRLHFKTHLENDKNIIYDNLFWALFTTSDFNLAKVYAIFMTCLVTHRLWQAYNITK